MQKLRMKHAALMAAVAAVVGASAHAQAESIFVSSMEIPTEVDATHPGGAVQQTWTWGDSFDSNRVDHARSSLYATDGEFSLYVHDPDGGFSWGTEYWMNRGIPIGHPPHPHMTTPQAVAMFDTVTTTTKLLMDFTTVPGSGSYAAGFGAINYSGGFLDSYNPSGLGKNYGVVGSPASQTAPRTQTYTWDFGPQMVLGAGSPWGGVQSYIKFHFANNGPAGVPVDFYFDHLRFVDENTAIHPTWQASGAGDWLTPASWANGVPNAEGARAIFYGAGDGNVTLNGNAMLGALILDAQVTSYQHIADAAPPPVVNYTVAGTGAIEFNAATGSTGELFVIAGSHNINVPVTFSDNLRIDSSAGFGPDSGAPINPPNGRTSQVPVTSLAFGGPVNLATGVNLSTSGAGSVAFNGALTGGAGSSLSVRGGSTSFGGNVDVGALNVSANAKATMTSGGNKTLKVGALGMSAGAKLDMTDNDLIVDHDGSVTEESIRQLVRNGRSSAGANGIVTTPGPETDDRVLAVADNGEWAKTTFNGIGIDSSTIVGKYTFFGDANLDGKVTGDDYVSVDANLATGDSWLEGDFNMNGVTTGDDYVAIDANLGKGTPDPLAFAELKAQMVALHVAQFGDGYLAKLADVEANGFATAVPEPAAVGLLALGAVGVLRRRRGT